VALLLQRIKEQALSGDHSVLCKRYTNQNTDNLEQSGALDAWGAAASADTTRSSHADWSVNYGATDGVRRCTAQWGAPVTTHSSLADFQKSGLRSESIHTIYGNQFPLDIYVKPVLNRPLLVCFHGAAPEGRAFTLPIFAGLDLAAHLDCALVACSDASLHLSPELRIGWFYGTNRMKLGELLHVALQKIIDDLRAPRVLFIGGSAGGFAAISMAQRYPDATTLVWNPQLSLRTYNKSLVESYFRLAFGLKAYSSALEFIDSNAGLDLVRDSVFARLARTFYLQNSDDHHHVSRQLSPLLLSLGRRAIGQAREFDDLILPSLRLFLSPWGVGHIPPPRSFLAALVKSILLARDLNLATSPRSIRDLLIDHLH
jgi:pimeloyl-ACP methyl ester carboxylesterase